VVSGELLPLPGLVRDVDSATLEDVSGCALEFTVPGKPRGWKRPRIQRRNGSIHTLNDDTHVEQEERVRQAAELAQGGPLGAWVRIEGPVRLEVATWHARPKRLRRRQDHGSSALAYTGKPDADNLGKLIMDGCTRAGTWRDDTLVADLTVRRRYLPLDVHGDEVGIERTVISVWSMGGAP